MTVISGIAVAGGASAALNVSYLVQHRALAETPTVRLTKPIQTVRGLLASPRWVAGAGCGYVGLALNITAMSLAPLWLVQATLAAGLALASSIWARMAGQSLRAAQRTALVLLAAGVVALGLAGAHGRTGVHTSLAPLAGFVGGFGLLAVLALRRMASAAPWRLGAAAGLSYGITTVALAALVATLHSGLVDPATVLLATSAGALSVAGGFMAFQRGLQSGQIAPVVTLMTATMNGVAMIGGLLLGGGLATSWPDRSLQLIGLISLCVASALASFGMAQAETPSRPPTPRRTLRLGRKLEHDASATLSRVLSTSDTTMRLGDRRRDGEPQPGTTATACRIGAAEAIERGR